MTTDTTEPVQHPDPVTSAEVAPESLIDFLRRADPYAISEAILNLSPEWWARCRAIAEARTAPYRVRVTRAMLDMPVCGYVGLEGVMAKPDGGP